ncbi:MAG: phytanoyl-CoA dioxygenase family protein [Planctomycetes bacterium]|nr:phytanoyl-CoA dioxygenase family protein [Planctomycetota bacterium]
MKTPDFKRPFPALTPTQRLHLEVYGYVVIEQAISADLTVRLRAKTYEIEEEFRRTGTFKDRSKAMFGSSREYFRIDNLPHVDPSYLEYVAHPYLVGMAEEIIGGEARLEQSDVHIRRPPANKAEQGYGFHRGAGTHFTWRGNEGLFHCHFVKTLTNLTDLGPDDGGTTVIAGSHKLAHMDAAEVIKAAQDDPRLIHWVVAPAGSTLLFYEATLHSSGIIRSDNDRVLIIGGYTPTMFQTWQGYEPEPDFVAQAPSELRPLLTGDKRYGWPSRTRRLADPAAERL